MNMPIKVLLTSALMLGCLTGATSTFAAYTGPSSSQPTAGGGYTGPGPSQTNTAEEAKKMFDDSLVTIRGNIVQHLGKDRYLLRDASGSITVEINADKWGGQNIGPADLVEISGDVDKDWTSVKIDVNRITKIAQ